MLKYLYISAKFFNHYEVQLMDQETLTNNISRVSKSYFEIACRLVLNDIFSLNAINIDGPGDGGTDYVSFDKMGRRRTVGYQITTQKTALKKKAYEDAQKAIENLGIDTFYYFTQFLQTEVALRNLEHELKEIYNIQVFCFDSKTVAGLLLNSNIVNKFLDLTDSPLPRVFTHTTPDYIEMALHAYTILSTDAKNMKDSIYDDTILLELSLSDGLGEKELLTKLKLCLRIDDDLCDNQILKRIDSLLSGKKIIKDSEKAYRLSDDSRKEVDLRKRLYDFEFNQLTAAQTELMQKDYKYKWSESNSTQISVLLANYFVQSQISLLKEIKANIVSNAFFQSDDSEHKIRKYLTDTIRVAKEDVEPIMESMIALAANHPLITKISRASVYLALDGANPISSAKALGANRWSEFHAIIDSNVAIPFLCDILYESVKSKSWLFAIKAIKKALYLDIKVEIPYYYISECAAHLIRALDYEDIDLDPMELQYSRNAFVSHYNSLVSKGENVPTKLTDYLSTFSSSVKTPNENFSILRKQVMSDLQSILYQKGVTYVHITPDDNEDDWDLTTEYLNISAEHKNNRAQNLIENDQQTLIFVNNQIIKKAEHWIIITNDKTMIDFGKVDSFRGWITTPLSFLNITDFNHSMSETEIVTLVHKIATYSERTLSAGARIIDKVMKFAAKEMKTWEFKQAFEIFKREMISQINYDDQDHKELIDVKTDEFLLNQGIKVTKEDSSNEFVDLDTEDII